MPEFTAKDVQRLRQVTGAGMLDCKKALEATDGEFDKAVNWLREKGLAQSEKRSDRASGQGAVAAANNGAAAALVEITCETDFVAKSPEVVNLLGDIAEAVAANGEGALADFHAAIEDLKLALKENMGLGRVVRFDAAPGNALDTYVHVQNDRGVNAVMVEVAGADRDVAHEVALHVASMRPRWLSRDEVPAEVVEAEMAVQEAKTRNEGKPEAAVAKIVEGRLGGFFKDNCLLEQAWVKDSKMSISQYLGSASVARFVQVEIGA